MSYPIKYTEAPRLEFSYDCTGVSCRAGSVEHDGDHFVCGDCGTSWGSKDFDEQGELYETWSGEERLDAQGPFDPDDWNARVVIPCSHQWRPAASANNREFCGKCLKFRDQL